MVHSAIQSRVLLVWCSLLHFGTSGWSFLDDVTMSGLNLEVNCTSTRPNVNNQRTVNPLRRHLSVWCGIVIVFFSDSSGILYAHDLYSEV